MAGSEQYVDLLVLQQELSGVIEENFPSRLWVKAEVASVQAKPGGHCYMELSQSRDGVVVAKARAVIWRSRWMMTGARFREVTGSDIAVGMTLLMRVQISYSELYGLSLVIDELEPLATVGEAELLRRRTIARLEEEGLMDAQKELALPALPYRLAVISSGDAAGYGDFRRHIENNGFGFSFSIRLFQALMQGTDAPASIAGALGEIASCPEDWDAALILRGGGSNLDLACFDDYSLAAAIAACPVPVLTAIGHDRDCHVADLVAWDHVKTPTALADVFIDAFAAEDESISSYGNRLRMAFLSKISGLSSALDVLESRILGADPRRILSRGYSLVTDAGGHVLKSASGLKEGDELRLYFSDGQVSAEVK